MADLITQDLAALDQRSRTQVRSLAATRAHVLSTPETSKMRFFKNRPILALAIVLALVGVASGGAYVVKHSFLTIDPSKPAPEIERDVESQLQQNGVTAAVNAEKNADGELQLTIMSSDTSLPQKLRDMGAIVGTPDGSGTYGDERRISVEDDEAKLDAAQKKRLTDALTSRPVIEALTTYAPEPEVKDAIEDALAEAGFTDVDVTTAGNDIVVKVKSPPSP